MFDMKKKFYWVLELALISIFTPFNSQAQITSIDKNTISSVIERNFPSFKGRLELHSADKQEGLDVFSQKSRIINYMYLLAVVLLLVEEFMILYVTMVMESQAGREIALCYLLYWKIV